VSSPLRVFYGGSFDPVHNGHLAIARAARDALQADVALVPARDPPHKDATHADADQRAQLLALALHGERGLRMDPRELHRAGPSYTFDTLAELRAEAGPSAPLAWLVGADALLQLDTWHRWRELFELAHIVAVQRPGAEVDAARLREQAPQVLAQINGRWLPPEALADSPAGGFALLPLADLRPESSTELRRRIAAGEPWRDWVPAAAAARIDSLHLYRNPAVILPAFPSSDRP
jgi:nicotinate-nucleotide adenylyltransferase